MKSELRFARRSPFTQRKNRINTLIPVSSGLVVTFDRSYGLRKYLTTILLSRSSHLALNLNRNRLFFFFSRGSACPSTDDEIIDDVSNVTDANLNRGPGKDPNLQSSRREAPPLLPLALLVARAES